MSKKFVVNAIALAVATAFAAPALAAGSVAKPSAVETYIFAKEVLGGTAPNPTAHVEGVVAFNLVAPDILIGRTNTSGDITVIINFSGATLAAAPVVVDFTNQGNLNGGSITSGPSSLQFTITPPATPGFVASSPLFSIAGGKLQFSAATGLSGSGISATVEVRDTNTNILLTTAPATVILTSEQASQATITSNTVANDTTIDVLQPSAKKQFLNGTSRTKLGEVAVALRDVDSATGGTQVASTLGTGAAANDNAGNFQFHANANIATTTNDKVKFTLDVPNDTGFTAANAFYAKAGSVACTAFAAGDVGFVKNTTTGKYEATAGIDNAAGTTYTLCAQANGTSALVAQTIGLTAQIDLAGALTIDPPAVSKANFAEWVYNGTVKVVQSFNPAANPAVDSLLRVINPSTIDGLVTIEGTCQDGSALTPASFTLQSKKAVQYSSAELESGNAGAGKPALSNGLGSCPAGRSRLVITGEFAPMEVQNFLRASTSIGVITSGHNNQD